MLQHFRKRSLFLGKKLPELDEQSKTDENLVKGCVSRVWLISREEDGKVFYQADSDAALTKGIIALLIDIYSGHSPSEILSADPSFLKDIGIMDNLSMNRRNGLANMIQKIFQFANKSSHT